MSHIFSEQILSYYNTPRCECGADAAKLGEYGHARWCPMFIAPPPVNDKCECGIGGWHSPLCRNRQWPTEPVDELKLQQQRLRDCIEALNNLKTDPYKRK